MTTVADDRVHDWTPRQEQIAEELLDLRGRRPAFDRGLERALKQEAIERFLEVSRNLPDGVKIYASKYQLADIHACEGLYQARADEDFEWSLANVVGTLAHRAIELLIVQAYAAPPLSVVKRLFDKVIRGAPRVRALAARTSCQIVDAISAAIQHEIEREEHRDQSWIPPYHLETTAVGPTPLRGWSSRPDPLGSSR